MCGIAGIISPNTSLIQQERLQKMANVLQHRGPDGEGFWIHENRNLGFAHRRLAIIDLSPQAAQPLHYRHYTIIFNGEIYNYKELKILLQQQGYSFATASDTEIIPAAFDAWGVDCLNKFDGMFAFALWNNNEQTLTIARDRFGEKPLYYHADYVQRGRFEQFVFASEMKALWEVGVPKNLDGTMMLNYLTLGYVQNPIKKTATFYSNILSLPQGHYLTISPAQGKVQMKQWYKPSFTNVEAISYEEKFRELFFTSVERRLRSDVSIGTSLSGGIDSSAVTAAIYAQKNITQQWKHIAFTASFTGFEKDELAYSKQVAEHFKLEQHVVSPTAADLADSLQQLMYHQEEPLQSSSVFTQFMVYRLAKENNITVLLDGQGSDEILSGYIKYAHWYLQQLFTKDVSHFFKERKLLQQNNFLDNWNWRNYAAAMFPDKASHALQHRAVSQQNNSAVEKEFLLSYQNKDSLQKPVVQQLEDILYYNTFNIGLPELLRYADRNSMAHSREVRLPFLFHELVEFIFSLPADMKIKNGFTKWILRQSMQQYLPKEIVWRTGKVGYEPPQKTWMQQKQMQELILDARKKLVREKILQPKIADAPVVAKDAHDADNFDWRYVCAAEMFGK